MKVLAIASAGGHWVQLLRLTPAFENQDVSFISTRADYADAVAGKKFFAIPDGSRRTKLRLFYVALCVGRIIRDQRPDVIITTGSCPGLIAIITAKFFRTKTIWIDSMANVERMSLSGRIAVFFADKAFTQWSHLSTPKVAYCGNVLE